MARYVGVDIAQNSLKQFTERLLTNSQGSGRTDHAKVTQLVCANMGTESLTESVLPCHTWHSGQFIVAVNCLVFSCLCLMMNFIFLIGHEKR